MHPSTIETKEKQFALTLKLADGTRFTETKVTPIYDGFEICSIRPANETYYYQTVTEKKSICLHFTVGYIMSDIAALTKAGNHVSVSYVVDRSGNIYELFPDRYWSYHLGSGSIGGNASMSKQTIGIEISNYGPLVMKDGKLKDAYGNTYCDSGETGLYETHSYRGYEAYATMSERQIAATAALLRHLAEKHGIPLEFYSGQDNVFTGAEEALAYRGIFYHSNVRKDKFDWPFSLSMKSIVDALTPNTSEPEPEPEPEPDMQEDEPVTGPSTVEAAEDPDRTPIAEKPAMASKAGWLESIIAAIRRLFGR